MLFCKIDDKLVDVIAKDVSRLNSSNSSSMDKSAIYILSTSSGIGTSSAIGRSSGIGASSAIDISSGIDISSAIDISSGLADNLIGFKMMYILLDY